MEPGDVEQMARALDEANAELPAGPNFEREALFLDAARGKARESGMTLMRICEEAIAARDSRLGKR